MSEVTYIWGAGASWGDRKRDKDGNITEFTRGLPIVNELERSLELLISVGVPSTPEIEAKWRGVSVDAYKTVCDNLSILKQACSSSLSIDTVAKQLSVTNRYYPFPDRCISYDDFKRYLAAALLMMQDENKRDVRYDGFIANIIDKHREIRPVTILSWNYDVQFELAYSVYYKTERYIPTLWKDLNVYNKMYPTQFDPQKDFAMFKLNGSALFEDSSYIEDLDGRKRKCISDCFYGGDRSTPFQYGYKYMTFGNYTNLLSYAWEEDGLQELKGYIQKRISDTEVLVVIGYSFPNFNFEIDSFILSNMPNLEKIVVQDKNFEDIKHRIKEILGQVNNRIEIVPENNLEQFYIPPILLKRT